MESQVNGVAWPSRHEKWKQVPLKQNKREIMDIYVNWHKDKNQDEHLNDEANSNLFKEGNG